MSIMHGCVDNVSILNLFMQYILCVYIRLIQYTVIVLEALVHEEVSSKTLCLHNAKYQCTANQQDY